MKIIGIRPSEFKGDDGQTVTGTQDLARVKLSLGPGDTVELTYLRDGVFYTVEVALVDSELID